MSCAPQVIVCMRTDLADMHAHMCHATLRRSANLLLTRQIDVPICYSSRFPNYLRSFVILASAKKTHSRGLWQTPRHERVRVQQQRMELTLPSQRCHCHFYSDAALIVCHPGTSFLSITPEGHRGPNHRCGDTNSEVPRGPTLVCTRVDASSGGFTAVKWPKLSSCCGTHRLVRSLFCQLSRLYGTKKNLPPRRRRTLDELGIEPKTLSNMRYRSSVAERRKCSLLMTRSTN